MRVVLQRVTEASVAVGDRVTGRIGRGMLVLAGFQRSDDESTISWMAEKIRSLRIFGDEDGKMNLSVEEVGGGLLVVSQFTLYGDARKGRRPSFVGAAPPDVAIPLYEAFLDALRAGSCPVETGEFGAMMTVALANDGPVTLVIDR